MRNYITFLVLLLFVFAGCSQQQPEPTVTKNREFFTPRNWRVPIKTKEEPQVVTPKEETAVAVEDRDNSTDPDEQMIGYASWYGPGFHGKKTANGEEYDQNDLTAAHKLLPMDTWVKVTNLENSKTAVVRINDRGPYKKNRIIDLTRKAADDLGFLEQGTARVSLEILKLPEDYDPTKGLKPYKQVVVQIAVFSTKERADIYQNNLAQRYTKLPLIVEERESKFYVLAGPYNEKDGAKKVSAALKQEGVDNFVRSYKK